MLKNVQTVSMYRRLGLVLLLVPLSSCNWLLDGHLNPRFCAAHPDDSECRGTEPDSGDTPCMTNAQCVAPMAVCELPQGTCVQCTPASHDACSGQTPVCATDNTCQACAAHSDCAANACLPNGACGDDSNVAYVDPTGSDNTMCTKAMPCTKVGSALGTARPYVKFQGTTDDSASINNQNVTLLADPGAKLTLSKNGILLEVKGTSQVAIYDLEITGGSGASGIGISLPAGNMAKLELHRGKLTNNSGGGIAASGGTVLVSQSALSGNDGGGVVATGGALTVSQSTLSGNSAGGISVAGNATFDITNNYIFRNGNKNSSAFGGLNLQFATAGTNRLAFNTIVDNDAATNSGGVVCNVSEFNAPNNVIARNYLKGSSTMTDAQKLGACQYPTSKIQNDVAGLAFAQPDDAPYSYKLATGSTAIDAATTPVNIDVDNEGDHRPQGAQKDIGADELKM